jgi:competence protein ComEC
LLGQQTAPYAQFLIAVRQPEEDNPAMHEPGSVSAGRISHQGKSARPGAWSAPLFSAAVFWTFGIVLDRYLDIPLLFGFLAAALSLAAWSIMMLGRGGQGSVIYIMLACAALGAVYLHILQQEYYADDIGVFASNAARPVQARGTLLEEPVGVRPVNQPDLQSMGHDVSTSCAFRVRALKREDDWLTVSGRALLSVQGQIVGLHAGDEVEVVGRLSAPEEPGNPGEFDYAAYLRDQRIRAVIRVVKTPDGVTRLERGSLRTPSAWLAMIRGWGERTFQEYVPSPYSGLASALLFGQSSEMTNADWDKYIRTAVIHVLAISGQHLVVLAGFLWWTLPLLRVSRRRAAWLVALLLLFYALLVGARPPVLRSAITVVVCCAGYYLGRPAMLGNALALSWLCVSVLNPADLATTGCQLSFLSVAVLYWCVAQWSSGEQDPLLRLVEQSWPAWRRLLHRGSRVLAVAFGVSITIWLAAAPLVVARYHLVSPIGILLGPPLTLLSAIALILGFLLLGVAVICPPLAGALGWLLTKCLVLTDLLVNLGDRLPAAYWYVSDVPIWWLWCFYLGLLLVLTVRYLRERVRWVFLGGVGWVCVGLLTGAARLPSDELRCTFLAVGHGGCTIIETPDGRTLLYDAGAMSGPEVTRRQIAPFLWYRGVRRIDEVFLSHADLDHFNGLPALLERFTVGQVTCTPTFSDKDAPGVRFTLDSVALYRTPRRIVHAGDRLQAGALEMEVLHPPAAGPEGNENARNLVLLLRHAGHTILLTGDLEGAGLARVLRLPPLQVDVLMAPHHGSAVSNRSELAAWARPRVVVSCEGRPRGPLRPPEPYSALGAKFLGTWPHGAVTVRSHATGLVVEAYRTSERFVAARGSADVPRP